MNSLNSDSQMQSESNNENNNFNDRNFEHILTNRENSFSIEVIY